MRHCTLAVVLAAFATLALPAQERAATDPLALVPADCQLVLHAQGPAAFAEQLAGTGLAKVFAGDTLAPVWTQFGSELDAMEREAPEAWRGLRPLLGTLAAQRGPIVLAVHLQVDDLVAKLAADEKPSFVAALVLGGEAASDLPELATSIGDLLRRAELGAMQEHTVAGEPLAMLQLPFGQLSMPVVRDGNLLMLFGTRLDRDAERFFNVPADQRFSLSPELRQAATALVLDVGATFDSLQGQLSELEGAGDDAESLAKVLPMLELPALRRLSWRLFADGTYVGQEAVVDLAGPLRGVWKVLMPPRGAPAAVLQYLPAAATTFATSVFDPRAFHDLYVRIFDGLGEAVPMSRAGFEELLLEKLKLRLKEDVLDHLTGEMLRIDDLAAAAAGVDEDELAARLDRLDTEYGDGCFVLPLRDGQGFAAALEKSVRAFGLHAARKSDEYAGTKVHRVVVLGSYVVEYAVTDKLLVVGFGGRDGTVRNLRSVLDAAAAQATGPSTVSLPTVVQSRLEGLPDGWSDIDAASLADAVAGMLGYFAQIEALADEALADDDAELHEVFADYLPIGEALKRLRPALLQHGADVAVTVTYKTDGRMVLRSRW